MNLKKPVILLIFTGLLLVGAEYSYARSGTFAVTVAALTKDKGGQDGDKKGKRGRGHERRGDRHDRDDDREARHHQKWSDRDSWRKQRDSDRESRRQQRWSDWNSHRQQRDSDRRSWRRDDDDDRGRRYRDYRRGRDDRRIIYATPEGFWNGIFNGGNGYGRQRDAWKDERKFWKEERKAQRRYEKARRKDSRSWQPYYNQYEYNRYSGPVYYNEGYNGDFYGYDGGSSWKDQILRTVIGSFLGGGFNAGGFIPAARYSMPDRYGYIAPSYAYRPASVPYYDSGDYDAGYGDLGGGLLRGGLGGGLLNDNLGGGLLGSLPLAAILQQYTGDNEFLSTLIGGFLSQGYEQGYLAALGAREDGYRGVAYDDPYVYSNGDYDPYSATLSENRRYLSEGYELGYRDALEGNAVYDPQSEGNVDLVSALLSNVLSGV